MNSNVSLVRAPGPDKIELQKVGEPELEEGFKLEQGELIGPNGKRYDVEIYLSGGKSFMLEDLYKRGGKLEGDMHKQVVLLVNNIIKEIKAQGLLERLDSVMADHEGVVVRGETGKEIGKVAKNVFTCVALKADEVEKHINSFAPSIIREGGRPSIRFLEDEMKELKGTGEISVLAHLTAPITKNFSFFPNPTAPTPEEIVNCARIGTKSLYLADRYHEEAQRLRNEGKLDEAKKFDEKANGSLEVALDALGNVKKFSSSVEYDGLEPKSRDLFLAALRCHEEVSNADPGWMKPYSGGVFFNPFSLFNWESRKVKILQERAPSQVTSKEDEAYDEYLDIKGRIQQETDPTEKAKLYNQAGDKAFELAKIFWDKGNEAMAIKHLKEAKEDFKAMRECNPTLNPPNYQLLLAHFIVPATAHWYLPDAFEEGRKKQYRELLKAL